jgi:hypothetical protein
LIEIGTAFFGGTAGGGGFLSVIVVLTGVDGDHGVLISTGFAFGVQK